MKVDGRITYVLIWVLLGIGMYFFIKTYKRSKVDNDDDTDQKDNNNNIILPHHNSTWQPWEYNWNKFPSLFFAANLEGRFTDEQIEEIIGKFSLAIIEFRHGQYLFEDGSGKWADGDLAGLIEEEAERIKASHPNLPVLTYRNALWAGTMFLEQEKLLMNEQDLFLPDERHCEGFIEYPLDIREEGLDFPNVNYCRYDFRKEETRNAFVGLVKKGVRPKKDEMTNQNETMATVDRSNIDGIFFDNGQSLSCDGENHLSDLSHQQRKEFQIKQMDVIKESFKEIVLAGKYPILSTTNGFTSSQVPFENDCPLSEHHLVDTLEGVPFGRNNEFWMWQLGDLAKIQIENTIEEARRGIPSIVHQPYFPSFGGCMEGCKKLDGTDRIFTQTEFLEFGIAAFLVSYGEGSYYGFSDMENDPECGGWCIPSWEYHNQYDAIVTGKPLGAATQSTNDADDDDDGYEFTRYFENGMIKVNVATGTYEFDLK